MNFLHVQQICIRVLRNCLHACMLFCICLSSFLLSCMFYRMQRPVLPYASEVRWSTWGLKRMPWTLWKWVHSLMLKIMEWWSLCWQGNYYHALFLLSLPGTPVSPEEPGFIWSINMSHHDTFRLDESSLTRLPSTRCLFFSKPWLLSYEAAYFVFRSATFCPWCFGGIFPFRALLCKHDPSNDR